MKFLLTVAAAASVALADPGEEARARALDAEIRCLVCQNEPIAQSTAEVAADMRALVRERIAAGDSDEEIRAFFRQRYGDFVLLRPPLDPRTWALWAAPFSCLGQAHWRCGQIAAGAATFSPRKIVIARNRRFVGRPQKSRALQPHLILSSPQTAPRAKLARQGA